MPTVTTGENGSGTATTTEQYYDEVGRLRWTKDGEGYVDYYSYNPSFGELAYMAEDVDPSDPSDEIEYGESGKWLAWTDGDADGNKPTRGGSLPDELSLATKYEYDLQGREFLRIDPPSEANPSGAKHYTAYEEMFGTWVIEFPYWDESGSPPISAMPTRVSLFDTNGRLSQQVSLSPYLSTDIDEDIPIGISDLWDPDQRVTVVKYVYDDHTGRLVEIQRLFDTDGMDSEWTAYFSTRFLYDAEGRVGAVIQGVEEDKYQVTVTLYDVLGRPTEVRRGVVDEVPETYAELAGSLPSGYKTVSRTIYDDRDHDGDDDIGDGHVTSTFVYHTDTGDYTQTNYHRTFRGFLRGEEGSENGSTDLLPVSVQDVDWLGRTIESAVYNASPSNWTNLVADDDYVAATSTNRYRRQTTKFDVLGRVYQVEDYPGADTNRLQTNNYHDRNGRLVSTGDKYSAHTEYAYDGAGRQYQIRTVTDVASTPYSSGKFQYRAPAPHPVLGSMSTTGDDGLIEFVHMVNDGADNIIAEHTFELNHTDTNGIDIDATDSYVRSSIYQWYDEADRMIASANYGSGDTASGAGAWKYASVPSRPSTAPTYSHTDVTSGRALLTTYTHDFDTGRLSVVSDPAQTETKTFYDNLSRRTAVAENYDNFSPPITNIGGTNGDEDRVTAWAYNGLGQVTTLTAYNGSSTNDQVTTYLFEDLYNAALVTSTIYPDSSDTDSTGDDQVKQTYNLDGSLDSKTDQRGIIVTYKYDDNRRLNRQEVTGDGGSVDSKGVDDAILSIEHTYDDLNRLTKVTSYDDPDGSDAGSPTIENQIEYVYHSTLTDTVAKIRQSHQDVTDSSTPDVEYIYDESATSGIYDDHLRMITTLYPLRASTSSDRFTRTAFGSANSITDRLHRAGAIHMLSDGGVVGDSMVAVEAFEYFYNGASRIAKVRGSTTSIDLITSSTSGNYDAWDRFGRTLIQKWSNYDTPSSIIDQFNYTYDAAGNRLSRDNPLTVSGGQDSTYEYDDLHRLKDYKRGNILGGVINPSGRDRQFEWTLDQLGNWATFKARSYQTSGWTLHQTRSHNSVNEIDVNEDHSDSPGDSIDANTASNWDDPEYDAAGNMTTMPEPGMEEYPPFFGNPTESYVLTYDAWNRLVKVESGETTVAEYEYDGLNQRIVKVVGEVTTDYYYNENWQLLTEARGGEAYATYYWHPYYIDALGLRIREEEIYSFLHDANYNVTAAVDGWEPNEATWMQVVERYLYSPYGGMEVLNTDYEFDEVEAPFGGDGLSDIDNEHFYTGRQQDPETQLQLNRHRYYHWALGRWLSRDPIGYWGGQQTGRRQWALEPNLYNYSGGRPLVGLDPSGRWFGFDDIVTGPVDEIFVGGIVIGWFTTWWYEDEIVKGGQDVVNTFEKLEERCFEGSDYDWTDPDWPQNEGPGEPPTVVAPPAPGPPVPGPPVPRPPDGPPLWGPCFIAGTKVTMHDGSQKPIEAIQIGDRIASWNIEKGKLDSGEVLSFFQYNVTGVIVLSIAGEEITTTSEHPFYVVTKGWTKAHALRKGDVLLMASGGRVPIENAVKQDKEATVYNISVSGQHNYFVGKGSYLVHNKPP